MRRNIKGDNLGLLSVTFSGLPGKYKFVSAKPAGATLSVDIADDEQKRMEDQVNTPIGKGVITNPEKPPHKFKDIKTEREKRQTRKGLDMLYGFE